MVKNIFLAKENLGNHACKGTGYLSGVDSIQAAIVATRTLVTIRIFNCMQMDIPRVFLKAKQSLATLKIQILVWSNSGDKQRGLENTGGSLISM